MKVISYWETVSGNAVPTYIPLCIASMREVLGDSFLLLTNKNASQYIGEEYLNKNWCFDRKNKNITPEIASVVAKSDFIRMAYVYRYGGFWLDADTIVLKNFLPIIGLSHSDDRLFWHSEQFFGANIGNGLLEVAQNKVIGDDLQIWGNPGGIKTLVTERAESVSEIPFKYINPGYVPTYNYKNCEILTNEVVPVESFLSNNEACLLKVYNSDFSALDIANMSVNDFFQSETLISRVFLKLNPSVDYWVEKVESIKGDL